MNTHNLREGDIVGYTYSNGTKEFYNKKEHYFNGTRFQVCKDGAYGLKKGIYFPVAAWRIKKLNDYKAWVNAMLEVYFPNAERLI